jgi:hypothetical protein
LLGSKFNVGLSNKSEPNIKELGFLLLLTTSSCFLDESAPIGLVAFAVLELAAGVANRANFANSDQAFLC